MVKNSHIIKDSHIKRMGRINILAVLILTFSIFSVQAFAADDVNQCADILSAADVGNIEENEDIFENAENVTDEDDVNNDESSSDEDDFSNECSLDENAEDNAEDNDIESDEELINDESNLNDDVTEEPEAGNADADETRSAPENGKSQSSQLTQGTSEQSQTHAYTLGPVCFKKVDNQDYAEEADIYCALTFSFTDTDENITYDCCVSGIRVSTSDYDEVSDEIDNNISGAKKTDLENLAGRIVSYYLSSHKVDDADYPFCIKNTDGQENWYDLVDAEKYSVHTGGSSGDQEPYGDCNLCWAAADSNVIAYTGWSEGKNEDQVFTSYTNAFFNKTGYSEYGLKWYFNSVTPAENMNDYNGDISLQSSGVNGTSERKDKTGAYFNGSSSYDAGSLYTAYSTFNGDSSDELSDAIINAVDDGDGIALSYCNVMSGVSYSAHAVTVFGYIKETLKTGIDAIKALFISDSDTDFVGDYTTEAVKNAEETESQRENQVNKYKLYYTDKTTDPWGREAIIMNRGVETPEDGNKEIVYAITTLKNQKKAQSIDADSGTQDSVNYPDIVPQQITFTDAVKDAGTALNFIAEFENISYKALCQTGCRPTVKYSVVIYDEQMKIYSESKYTLESMTFSAMQKEIDFQQITIDNPGTYFVGVRVDEIGYYNLNNEYLACSESYLNNNSIKENNLACITVTGEMPPDDDDPSKDDDPSEDDKPNEKDNTSYSAQTAAILHFNFFRNQNEKLEIKFEKCANDGKLVIYDISGNEISDEYYEITYNADGSATVVFTDEFINTLPYGISTFILENMSGRIYFEIAVY